MIRKYFDLKLSMVVKYVQFEINWIVSEYFCWPWLKKQIEFVNSILTTTLYLDLQQYDNPITIPGKITVLLSMMIPLIWYIKCSNGCFTELFIFHRLSVQPLHFGQQSCYNIIHLIYFYLLLLLCLWCSPGKCSQASFVLLEIRRMLWLVLLNSSISIFVNVVTSPSQVITYKYGKQDIFIIDVF